MRATYLIGLLLSLSLPMSLWANSTLVANNQFCLHNQLTSQNWQGTPGTVWQFDADGRLLQIVAEQQQVYLGQWDLQSSKAGTILKVNLGNGQVYWSLASDCSATTVQLTANEAQTLQINALPAKSVNREWLIGDWQQGLHTNQPVLTFAADGTYQKLCQSTGTLELTTGHWMISHDGSTILLYRREGHLEAYDLKYLNMDELVMRAYEPEASDCFLNKM